MAAAAAPLPAMEGSPARRRLSRREEREELRRLNDRLAAYIERVRGLELENGRLLLRVSEKEEEEQTSVAREAPRLQALFQAQLDAARRAREAADGEGARLREQAARLRAQQEELERSLKKKSVECASWRSRSQELEGLLRRSEGEVSAALGEKRGLEGEVSALGARLSRSEEAHALARRQLEAETLLRVDAENRGMSLQEEIRFQKSLFEQEVREVRQRHLVEEAGPARKELHPPQHQHQLALALEELRRQHQAQLELYREELEEAYRVKLENAKLSSDQSGQAAGAAREELREARLRIEALAAQLSAVQRQASGAEERLREAEGRLSGEREAFRSALAAKEAEAREMREERQRQLAEYQELLDVKLALDMEIAAYRKLLEGEEQRLNLSPSASPRPAAASCITVSRATSSSCLRGKRKRREAQETSNTSHTSSQRDSAQGRVGIEEVDPEGRFVRLRNGSEEDQPLGNWRLRRAAQAEAGDVEAGAAANAYKFGARFVLRAGQSVTVWSGDAGVAHGPPSDLVWKGRNRPWAPGERAQILLLDAHGQEVAARSLSPEEEREEEAAFGEEDLFHQQGDPRTTSKGCAVM